MKALLTSNKTYFIAFIILTALNLFFSFTNSIEPMGVRIVNFLFAFIMSLTVYVFFTFIFVGAAQIVASLCQSLSSRAKQDPEIPNTFLIANLLYLFLFLIFLKSDINRLKDTPTEVSIESFLFYIYPFFTSLIGGILSGCLVLLSEYSGQKIVNVGRVLSIAAVLFFFAYQFLTIRS